jgi:DNA-binding MarR family transcriptional regulator
MGTALSPDRAGKVCEEGMLATNIGYHIAQAEVATMRFYYKHIGAPFELRPIEYSLLVLLQTNEELSPKQLAQALSLPAPSLTMLVDRLRVRGLLERVRSETDRRSQRVLLTAAGRELTRKASACSAAMDAELDQALTPGEQMILTELLQKVAELGRHRN